MLGEVVYGPFRIDDLRKELSYMDQVLELSPTEYELLKYIVMNNGIVLSKALILNQVWGYHFGGEENIVEVYIRSLREKLQDKEHRLIRTTARLWLPHGFSMTGRKAPAAASVS